MIDPRISIINERMGEVDRIIAISSGKGGVGKSLVASILALILVKKGYKVGLFDLDFTSPSTHIILGVDNVQPIEEKGVVPPLIYGLRYMTIVYYSGSRAVPLRGPDISNALIEMFSITRWGKLDFLIIDMPPGIGDATLDILRLIKRISFLIVTTPSRLAFETVRKLIGLLKDLKIPTVGIVENMKMNKSSIIRERVDELGVKFLGEIAYDQMIERVLGNVHGLLRTSFAGEVERLVEELIKN
ncbi:MAG: ATP-binding protein [Thermoproteota archaeon]